MKILEINNMTVDEIKRTLEDTQETYANLRFQKATHELDNPVKLRYLRKDIARLKSVVKEYELGIRKQKVRPGQKAAEVKE